EIVSYGFQIAEGLAHAHRHGIIHRDLKTDNLMLTAEGKVKITDFGLAKLHGQVELTKAGSTLGTAAYMSPEQIRSEAVDHRSDLFSLGVILYELTTGSRPFRGEHEAALTYSIVNEDPKPIALLRVNAPQSLEQIILRCLSKEPEKRYQSADEIVADFHSLQQELSGRVTTVVKHSKTPWMIAAALVILGAIGFYFFYRYSTPRLSENSRTVAVLPFANLSGNPDDEFFSNGITEDILTQLSKIGQLNVISRTTMMQYKGAKKTLREIGEELNAGVIVEGSVRRAGNQVRITAQLIDANTDKHLWAETYDKEFKHIFAIQSDVAEKIAAALQATLSAAERERIAKAPTENTDAYTLYLKGRENYYRYK
ncbi:MAG: serine/threonine-protein kinase, partial [Bacteroidota bacterium]